MKISVIFFTLLVKINIAFTNSIGGGKCESNASMSFGSYNGFEDRGAHQSPSYLHIVYQIITEDEQNVNYKICAKNYVKIWAVMSKKGLLLT